jgi:energy-converting hydrogenase A subunit M
MTIGIVDNKKLQDEVVNLVSYIRKRNLNAGEMMLVFREVMDMQYTGELHEAKESARRY